jgi:hypothetical protein
MPEAIASPDVHPDYLGGPLTEVFTIRTSKAMGVAIRRRALLEGRDAAFLIRELIRAGAPHLKRPLDISSSL